MHSDIHTLLHTYHSAELHREAAVIRPVRRGLKSQVGWKMVEFGLRLVQERPAPAVVRRMPRTA
ncbi:hypothetical protein OG413_16580 [Streptomyces sp. NBC_01433]|uniref:hypothetical protein n=1 Tax=Streptomyces sp. NBC_01433 TaxID=2903864 RepID=UPI00225C3A43|nr:hypothetical protein [Streptomyces sp. NBC_01433]MCX4676899.1 hypothetical protein [Streptomyces sp. NBC_01433]